MHFGLFSLMTQRDRGASARQLYQEMVEQVKMAEQIGFDIAWFAEHHFSNYCLCPSPLAMAIALAPQTTKIRLGTAVIVAPLYHPLRMLEEIGMLDVISNGRAVIGIGTGYQQYEFHRFGISLETARDTFLESLDILEQYLAGGPVSYEGKAIRIPETHFVVHPIQKKPEVYVAGLARDPVTQARVAAGGYVPIFTTGWTTIAEMRATRDIVTAANPGAGGDMRRAPYAMQRYVFVTDDKNEALKAAEAARYIRRVAMSMRNNVARLDGAFLREIEAPDEPPLEEIAARLVVGDAETCAAKLAVEIEALQPTHVSCFMGLPAIEQSRTLRSMEQFGTKVMPALERHFGSLSRIGVAA
jgi:alkanesulfonate monooxygenase SsuD/methylene tetrahydromethanopterin reductase-like flavin-dependent oxidoreductase (luciferase family)